MTVIVLLGAPGAGKGTQADVLADRLGIPHVATGDLFRAAVRDGSPMGLEARRYMERGQLVPDDITIRMLLDRLARPDAAGGVILDGFPRNLAQALVLDQALEQAGRQVDRAILIDVPIEDLVRRMADRRVCAANGHVYNLTSNPPLDVGRCDLDGSDLTQRTDDREDTVRARMDQQVPVLLEVVTHYLGAGILRTVDGRRSIDEISRDIVTATDASADHAV